MPAKHARHIALSGPLAEWAKAQVANGEYSSLSELIRTALRELREREEARASRTGVVALTSQQAEPHA